MTVENTFWDLTKLINFSNRENAKSSDIEYLIS